MIIYVYMDYAPPASALLLSNLVYSDITVLLLLDLLLV